FPTGEVANEMRAVFHLFAASIFTAILFTAIPGHAGYAAEFKEADVALWIASQGGTVERDAAGRTTAVNLRAAWITDTDLARLAGLPRLARLDLSHTNITDFGMERLASLASVNELDLGYAEHLTDAGIAHLKGWK